MNDFGRLNDTLCISQGWNELAEFARSSVCFVADVPHAAVQQWMCVGSSPLKVPKNFANLYWGFAGLLRGSMFRSSPTWFRKR